MSFRGVWNAALEQEVTGATALPVSASALRLTLSLPLSPLLRVLCPANCKTQPSYWAPVVGSNFYADVSIYFQRTYFLLTSLTPREALASFTHIILLGKLNGCPLSSVSLMARQ